MDRRAMRVAALRRFVGAAVLLGGALFLSAGSLRFWQAWVYLAVLFVPVTLVVRYLLRHDPDLLERRLKTREERGPQRAVQVLGSVLWLAVLVVPGLDQRFGWSSLPWPVVVAGDVGVLAGYLLFFFVIRENSFASRVIEVQQGQRVVTTGPYALVRHPMYLAVVIMLLASPIALDSLWALIPAVVTPMVLVSRIRDEEAMLMEDLPGYREYAAQTRYRLIPGVW